MPSGRAGEQVTRFTFNVPVDSGDDTHERETSPNGNDSEVLNDIRLSGITEKITEPTSDVAHERCPKDVY